MARGPLFTGGNRPPGFRSDRNPSAATDPARPLLTFAHNVYVAKDRSILALGVLFVRQAKVELSKPGQGRIYVSRRTRAQGQRTKRGQAIRHRASRPGDPPAVDLGELRGSIDVERVGWAHVRVGTANPWSIFLEPPAKLRRPFLRTALAKVRAAWGRRIVTDLQRVAP